MEKYLISIWSFPFNYFKKMGNNFDNKKVKNLCRKLEIKKHFSFLHHPQMNEQLEVINETINTHSKGN